MDALQNSRFATHPFSASRRIARLEAFSVLERALFRSSNRRAGRPAFIKGLIYLW
jgi:hypothetical protein